VSADIDTATEPTLSVIVPVHNSTLTIERCVNAVLVALDDADELIVVDDASTDDGLAAIEATVDDERVTIVRLGAHAGRGPARNTGADRAMGDVLVFVDSDVVLHDDALGEVRKAFGGDRDCLIGAYDDEPGGPGVVSDYRNLLHHHVHASRGTPAAHFWTGVGAVRRTVFEKAGGLDETDWAHDMEDVEFGHRLTDLGFVIDVLPHIQGTHLKDWTLRTMVATDVGHRALPWSLLLLRTGVRKNDFVLSPRQVVSAVSTMGTIGGSVGVLAGRKRFRMVLLASVVAFLAANAPVWSFLRRSRGWTFLAASVPLHFLHSLSSALGFAIAVVLHLTRGGSARTGPR
jgi:glycosyltransferase involved in cell wall biosynthesis